MSVTRGVGLLITFLCCISHSRASIVYGECNDFCPMIYAPVCGSDGVTHPNNCAFEFTQCDNRIKGRAEISVTCQGECPCNFVDTPDDDQDAVEIPENCSVWFDGCNTCSRMEGGEFACTEMACSQQQTPECREFQAVIDENSEATCPETRPATNSPCDRQVNPNNLDECKYDPITCCAGALNEEEIFTSFAQCGMNGRWQIAMVDIFCEECDFGDVVISVDDDAVDDVVTDKICPETLPSGSCDPSFDPRSGCAYSPITCCEGSENEEIIYTSFAECTDGGEWIIAVADIMCPQCQNEEDCNSQCPENHRPVCASDGFTYSNICFFQYEKCAVKNDITVECQGECPCESEPQECTWDEGNVGICSNALVIGVDISLDECMAECTGDCSGVMWWNQIEQCELCESDSEILDSSHFTPIQISSLANGFGPMVFQKVCEDEEQSASDGLQDELDTNEALWETCDSTCYSFDLRTSCYCPPQFTSPKHVIVNGDQVVVQTMNGREAPPNTYPYRTIEEFFGFVQEIISASGDANQISYDSECGFPVSISADPIPQAIDDEIAFEITNFQQGGCDTGADILAEVESNMELWDTCNVDNCYTFDYSVSCFCLPDWTAPKHVVVNGDDVQVSLSDGSMALSNTYSYSTISDFFTHITDILERSGDANSVEYDSECGYPISISADPLPMAVDDESHIQISNMQIGVCDIVEQSSEQEKLSTARESWASCDVRCYSYDLDMDCICDEELKIPKRISYDFNYGQWQATYREDGSIVPTDVQPSIFSIEDAFDFIHNLLSVPESQTSVTYDSSCGFPTEIIADPMQFIEDVDTVTYTLSNFMEGECPIVTRGRDCHQRECGAVYDPVCATNDVTYSNMCYLATAQCQNFQYEDIVKTCDGVCPCAEEQEDDLCADFSFSSCSTGDSCPEGSECVVYPDGPCVSSGCVCDPRTGEVNCTPDCSGGVCMPITDDGDAEADDTEIPISTPEEILANPRAWFDFWDKDSTGILAQHEVVFAFMDLSGWPEEEIVLIITALWSDFDPNNDLQIEYFELDTPDGILETIEANLFTPIDGQRNVDDDDEVSASCPEAMPEDGTPCDDPTISCEYNPVTCCPGAENEDTVFGAFSQCIAGAWLHALRKIVCPECEEGDDDIATDDLCAGHSYTSCARGDPCPEGTECKIYPDGPCVSSGCSCDPRSGQVACLADCGGGTCEPISEDDGGVDEIPSPEDSCPETQPSDGDTCTASPPPHQCEYNPITCCPESEQEMVLYGSFAQCVSGQWLNGVRRAVCPQCESPPPVEEPNEQTTCESDFEGWYEGDSYPAAEKEEFSVLNVACMNELFSNFFGSDEFHVHCDTGIEVFRNACNNAGGAMCTIEVSLDSFGPLDITWTEYECFPSSCNNEIDSEIMQTRSENVCNSEVENVFNNNPQQQQGGGPLGGFMTSQLVPECQVTVQCTESDDEESPSAVNCPETLPEDLSPCTSFISPGQCLYSPVICCEGTSFEETVFSQFAACFEGQWNIGSYRGECSNCAPEIESWDASTILENSEEWFNYWDTNNNGVLDEGEMLQALLSLSSEFDSSIIAALWGDFDPTGEGVNFTDLSATDGVLETILANFGFFSDVSDQTSCPEIVPESGAECDENIFSGRCDFSPVICCPLSVDLGIVYSQFAHCQDGQWMVAQVKQSCPECGPEVTTWDVDMILMNTQEWFNYWDSDASGFLDESEILAAMLVLSPEFDGMIISALWSDFDPNGNGIDFSDLSAPDGVLETILVNLGLLAPHCLVICTREFAPVCGSDGSTYSNECLYSVANCENPEIMMSCEGECPCPTPTGTCDVYEISNHMGSARFINGLWEKSGTWRGRDLYVKNDLWLFWYPLDGFWLISNEVGSVNVYAFGRGHEIVDATWEFADTAAGEFIEDQNVVVQCVSYVEVGGGEDEEIKSEEVKSEEVKSEEEVDDDEREEMPETQQNEDEQETDGEEELVEEKPKTEEEQGEDDGETEGAGQEEDDVATSIDQRAHIHQRAYINEFHYDNAGTDVDEFIEIAVCSDAVECFEVRLYNGADASREVYATLNLGANALEGVNENYYVLEFPENGIQNGSPDGIMLIYDPVACGETGDVEIIEFLSYGGDFTTNDELAASSTDMSVFEPSDTEIGMSLQRISDGDNITYILTTHTKGNANQSSGNPCGDASTDDEGDAPDDDDGDDDEGDIVTDDLCGDYSYASCALGDSCPQGTECKIYPDGPCISSGCVCDPQTGEVNCVPDCGGGSCEPIEDEQDGNDGGDDNGDGV